MQILAELLVNNFVSETKLRMVEESFSKISSCLSQLSEEEVWHRPNEHVNSVGNLMLHLCGNVGQYVISGAGGHKDIRERQKEFDDRGTFTKEELIEKMRKVLAQVVEVLDQLTPEQMIEVRPVQCYEMSVISMILHATEHFSYHTGQIIYYTKMLRNKDMAFYAGLDLDA